MGHWYEVVKWLLERVESFSKNQRLSPGIELRRAPKLTKHGQSPLVVPASDGLLPIAGLPKRSRELQRVGARSGRWCSPLRLWSITPAGVGRIAFPGTA